eukprot:Skav200230  [mRNA]  locus=scaffold2352:273105:276440:- [translate_table: standard]
MARDMAMSPEGTRKRQGTAGGSARTTSPFDREILWNSSCRSGLCVDVTSSTSNDNASLGRRAYTITESPMKADWNFQTPPSSFDINVKEAVLPDSAASLGICFCKLACTSSTAPTTAGLQFTKWPSLRRFSMA